MKRITIIQQYLVLDAHNVAIDRLELHDHGSLKVPLGHAHLEVVLSSRLVDLEPILILLESDAIFLCWSQLQLGTIHEIEHSILEYHLALLIILINLVKVDILRRHKLKPLLP